MNQTFVKLGLPVVLALAGAPSHAVTNLVTNGDFESNGGNGQLAPGISFATGWTNGPNGDGASSSFNFILDTTADDNTTGFVGGFKSIFSAGAGKNIFVWGPDNGSNNGFTGSANGGKFLGGDGAYAAGAVSQQINGLVVGHSYSLSFEWAASQFTDASGNNFSGWNVNFGGESASTGTVANASHGFVPWMNATFNFTASSASQALSFLAVGGPSGLPPFALLDGVSLVDVTTPPPPVPEPASVALLLGGLGLVGALARRRGKTSAA